jgi:hypothetical protein
VPNESNNTWAVALSEGTRFGASGSGTWQTNWTARPTWSSAGEGQGSAWTGPGSGIWHTEATPDAAQNNNRLTSISCPTSTFCMATAYEIYNGADFAYAERWNGSAWTIAGIEGNGGMQLNGVSCTSSTACAAVGSLTEAGGNVVTVAESWNGSTWTRQTTSDEPATRNELAGVACVSSMCRSVGQDVDTSGSWNFVQRQP